MLAAAVTVLAIVTTGTVLAMLTTSVVVITDAHRMFACQVLGEYLRCILLFLTKIEVDTNINHFTD